MLISPRIYLEAPERSMVKKMCLCSLDFVHTLVVRQCIVPMLVQLTLAVMRGLGGFFCPCHGSTFDLSGRVFCGVPAPTNLDIPPYSYESDDVLIIGIDPEVA